MLKLQWTFIRNSLFYIEQIGLIQAVKAQQIIQVTSSDQLPDLVAIARTTFIETFAHLNDPKDFDPYVEKAFSREHMAAELANEASTFYLMLVENKPAGYIKLNRPPAQTDLQDPDSLEIERIYVLNQYHGLGLGKQLFELALQRAKNQGLGFIWLGAWQKNDKALKFYRDRGFYKFAEHAFKLGDDLQTDDLMRLDL